MLTGTHDGLCVLWCLQKRKKCDDAKDAQFRAAPFHAFDVNTSAHDENNNKGVAFNMEVSGLNEEDDDLQYFAEPFAVLYGHESTVTDMTECVYDFTPAVCSASLDGSLCVWNLSDGRCMAVASYVLSGAPTSIVAFPGGNQVACAGRHNKIEIVDLRQLKVVGTLEAHMEWVTSLSCGAIMENSGEERAVMLSVSEDNTLRYWYFQDLHDKMEWDQMPAFTVKAQINRPLCVTHADDFSYVMVVGEDKWMLFTFKAIEPKHIIPAPEGKKLKGGLFIDAIHVILYTVDGDGYVYKLPKIGSKVAKTGLPKRTSMLKLNLILEKNPKKNEASPDSSSLPKSRSITANLKELITPSASQADTISHIQSNVSKTLNSLQSAFSFGNKNTAKGDVKKSSSFMSFLGFGNDKKVTEKKSALPSTPSQDNLAQKQFSSKPPSMDDLARAAGNLPSLKSQDSLTKSKTLSVDNLAKAAAILPSTNSQDNLTQSGLQQQPSQDYLLLNIPDVKIVESVQVDSTSIGAALASAFSSNITEPPKGFTKESQTPREKPSLIECLREDEQVKASLGSSVWRSQHNIVIRADTSGSLKVWKIDIADKEKDFKEGNLLFFEDIQTMEENENIHIQEVTTSTLASGWPKATQGLARNSRITASQFAIDNKDKTSKLIHGYLDGYISIIPSVSNEIPTVFKGHASKVTALLILHDDDNDRSLLVSGSADYTVKVWDLANAKLLATFYYHSGVITLLFFPPKTIRKKLQNCFCSVGEDHSVIIYSLKTLECIHVLGGHSSSVIAVYWRVDLDYLIVRCSDGSLCIWQLSTGLLERRVFGRVAAELIDRSEGPGASRRPTVKISFSKQSAYSDQSKGFLESLALTVSDTEPDVQLLILSVRRLVGYINSKKEILRDHVTKKEQSEPSLPHSLISALSYVLQYGKHRSLQQLREKLNIEEPTPPAYIGLKGAGSTFSLIVPKASERSHPFIFSPVLSALHTISTVAILNALAQIPELKKLCQEAILYYLHEMPKDFEHYEDPSFLWCAQFLKDASKEIQKGARQVMVAVLQRMPAQARKSLADKLANIYLNSITDPPSSARKQNVVVALAVLAYKVKEAVDKEKKQLIAGGLIEILQNRGPQHTTAISLLGDGFAIWRDFIPDLPAFCRQLFHFSLPALTTVDPKTFADSVSTDALQAFINMSAIDTRLYVEFINGIIVNAQQTLPSMLAAAITSVYPLVHKYPICLIDHLVVITSLLLKVLDPHFPQIRDACMPASTNILRYLVEVFPMVNFHQEKQKLAVGNHEGIVVIYDMKTASKWQLFEAHKTSIASLVFSPNGELLACFSAKEGSCRIFKIDGSGVLNLLGVAISSPYKTYEVPQVNCLMTQDEVLKFVRLEWDSNRMFSLKPGKNKAKLSFAI